MKNNFTEWFLLGIGWLVLIVNMFNLIPFKNDIYADLVPIIVFTGALVSINIRKEIRESLNKS